MSPLILADPDSGATRAELVDRVCAQSFSEARYGSLIKTWLNDAVLELCRRLQMFEGAAICAFDTDGVVTQPASPFFVVREAHMCTPGATGTTEAAIRAAARYQLAPLQRGETLAQTASTAGQPTRYTVRRARATAGSVGTSSMQIVVDVAGGTGAVGIIGLQRPPAMDADDDVTGLGGDFDDAVVAFAKARAFRQEDDFEMRDRWMGEFELALRQNLEVGIDDGPIITPGLEGC